MKALLIAVMSLVCAYVGAEMMPMPQPVPAAQPADAQISELNKAAKEAIATMQQGQAGAGGGGGGGVLDGIRAILGEEPPTPEDYLKQNCIGYAGEEFLHSDDVAGWVFHLNSDEYVMREAAFQSLYEIFLGYVSWSTSNPCDRRWRKDQAIKVIESYMDAYCEVPANPEVCLALQRLRGMIETIPSGP